MGKNILLADFGSTFTKASVINLQKEQILTTTQAPTTVNTDITIGFKNNLKQIEEATGLNINQFDKILASSSAAGGLRMIVIGLVPELTVEAARRVSLGAGAKVINTYAFELTEADINEIEEIDPDIIILAGGTDGGNKDNIVHNAEMLADAQIEGPIIVAGNRVVSDKVNHILTEEGKKTKVTANVMPKLGEIEVNKVKETIREVFVKHIIKAKGLNKVKRYLDDLVLPTPAAVLNCAELLAKGIKDESGYGDLIVIDVGGATTDVHSACSGEPGKVGVVNKGLPEPYGKRTVEGDLGIRYNAPNIIEKTGWERILKKIDLKKQFIKKRMNQMAGNVNTISITDNEKKLDKTLAKFAVKTAMERHAGRMEKVYSTDGEVMIQYGKDLTEVSTVIGCGGIFRYGETPESILKATLYDNKQPWILKPENPKFLLDKNNIMAHMGLLKTQYPVIALRLLKKNLKGGV